MELNWINTVDPYIRICLEAARNDTIFDSFRRNPAYTQVLEHVSQEDGHKYFDIIKRTNLVDYFDMFKTSECFGSPIVYEYEGNMFSPTTLRYIKVLYDLIKIFGDLSGFKIAEIGGGYGGQCKIIKDIFDVDYHMIDLPEVNLLARRFLGKTRNGARFSAWDQLVREDYDLVISNHAFSELNYEIQDHYYKMIIAGSSNGYMTCNIVLNANSCYQIEDYKKMGNVVFMVEEPNTHPDNFIIYWNG